MLVDPETDVVYSLCISDKTRLDAKKRNEGRCSCFLHAAYCLPTRRKLLYTVANRAHGLLNKKKEKKSLAA